MKASLLVDGWHVSQRVLLESKAAFRKTMLPRRTRSGSLSPAGVTRRVAAGIGAGGAIFGLFLGSAMLGEWLGHLCYHPPRVGRSIVIPRTGADERLLARKTQVADDSSLLSSHHH